MGHSPGVEGQALDLIVTLDDATGAIYSAFLVEEEGTASTFRALKEVFSAHGLPMSLYTDRGSHYFCTTKTGEIDRGSPTHVGRALGQLGVEHIGAYSPQARGRSERTFATLQDRLVKELRLAGVTEIEAANAFMREVYLPAHNARFAVQPAGEAPKARCGPISSGRGSRSMSIPTARTPSSTGRAASAATTRTGGSRTTALSNAPLNSARRRGPVDGMDKPPACPTPPTGEQKQKKRTNLVLPKPDNFIRYRQPWRKVGGCKSF
jgi:hypothetical protein